MSLIDFGRRTYRADFATFAEWYADKGAPHENTSHDDTSFSGKTRAEALALMRGEDLTAAADVTAALDKVAALDFETDGEAFEAGPVGFAPNVPAVLAGTPDPMWQMVPDPQHGAPCRMRVNIQAAALQSNKQIRLRIVAAVALAQVLARSRSVSVVLVSYCDIGRGRRNKIEIDLGCAPLDAGRIAAVCDPAFYRRAIMAKRCHLNRLTGAAALQTSGTLMLDSRCHEAQPDELILPRAMPDDFRRIENDPAGWIDEKARAFLSKAKEHTGAA